MADENPVTPVTEDTTAKILNVLTNLNQIQTNNKTAELVKNQVDSESKSKWPMYLAIAAIAYFFFIKKGKIKL